VDIEVFVTPGLGDNTFVIVSGDEAAVIDPQRDARRFVEAATGRRARVRSVLETHVHNDYVSGMHEIRAATGAELVLPGAGDYAFDHRRAVEGEEVLVGDLRLVAMDTPGHTYEHIAWLVHEQGDDVPVAVFTGGSLLVGSAGRSDLLGPDHTDALTRHQFETVRRLAELPDSVRILPTHGAGSFCVAAMPSTERTTTLGAERKNNPLVGAVDLAEFTEELTGELMAYPAYYPRMAPINRAGAPVLGSLPVLGPLTIDELKARSAEGAVVVDTRERDDFARVHIPGSLNIELNSGFGSYVGWLLEFGAPLVLVLPDPACQADAVTQLFRIGWPAPLGYLDGGVEAWQAAGEDVRSYPSTDVTALCAALGSGEPNRVIDVRQPLEWMWGTAPNSERVFVADLPARLDDVAGDVPAWVICSNGHRAAIAASLLDDGRTPVRLVGVGGVGELGQKCSASRAAKG
jgi:hydroxyacylglutathione hydrolase